MAPVWQGVHAAPQQRNPPRSGEGREAFGGVAGCSQEKAASLGLSLQDHVQAELRHSTEQIFIYITHMCM